MGEVQESEEVKESKEVATPAEKDSASPALANTVTEADTPATAASMAMEADTPATAANTVTEADTPAMAMEVGPPGMAAVASLATDLSAPG